MLAVLRAAVLGLVSQNELYGDHMVLESRESYDIVAALPGYRVRCAEFLGALQAELHRVAAAGGGDRCKLPRAEHTRLAQSLTQVVSRGCRLMCALNALLAEFIAYKCAHVYDICGVT